MPLYHGSRRLIMARRVPARRSADAAETTAFLARRSGLDAMHVAAYKALINGLMADGVFAKLDGAVGYCNSRNGDRAPSSSFVQLFPCGRFERADLRCRLRL